MDNFLFDITSDGDRVAITEEEFTRRYRQPAEERQNVYTRIMEELLRSDEFSSMTWAGEFIGYVLGTTLAEYRAEQNPEYAEFSEAERQAWQADHQAELTAWFELRRQMLDLMNLVEPL